MVVPDVWGALYTLQLPGAWEGAELTYAGLQAAQCRLHQPCWGVWAVWGNAGTGGALWHEQQHCLTNQFGDMRVVKLLHAGSLSQELLNVS